MVLYKYFSPRRISIFSEWKIRFSPPSDFNDPFEMLPHAEVATVSQAEVLFEEQYEKIVTEMYDKESETFKQSISREQVEGLASAKRAQLRTELLGIFATVSRGIAKEFLGRMGELVGILCLTERRDSLLMWGHYAASHTGFVIGLDSEHPFFHRKRHDEDQFGYLRKLAYTQERPSVALVNVKGLDEFFVKSTEWEYEREWRFPLPLARATEVDGAMEQVLPLFDLPPSAVKEVIFGCRMPVDRAQEVMEALKARSETENIELYRAEPDERYFVLNFKKLP